MTNKNWISKCKEMLMASRTPRTSSASSVAPARLFKPPEILPGVVPNEIKLGMDSAAAGVYDYANILQTHEIFMGYPALAQLTQKPEFRLLGEKPAQAMVRKWIEIKSTGKEDKSALIANLEEQLKHFKIRELFEEMAKQDNFMGRAQIFVDMGEHNGKELEAPLIMVQEKLFGKLRKFKLIEAMYSYPVDYRTDNPLADSYYNPQAWYVMGQKVHSSRLLLFVGRPVPTILKPAYNFGGMSMTQLAMPYVDNWLSTRQAVNRLIRNFSITGIKTNMQAVLAGDSGGDLVDRAELYNSMRDNQGLFVMDKDQEEMFQLNTPLSTLDKLQAQSQEHMSSISSIPLMVLFGISPTGLNASSEGEIRVWYDFIRDMQETLFRDNLKRVIEIIMLSKWGFIDQEITFDFVSLWEPTSVEVETSRKARAETDAIYVEMSAISPDEVRSNLSQDPDSGYVGLPELNPVLMQERADDKAIEIAQANNPQANAPEFGE